jgi:hypothetical protein
MEVFRRVRLWKVSQVVHRIGVSGPMVFQNYALIWIRTPARWWILR